MAYQSPENAQKLRDMPRVATNNADPARSLMGDNVSPQSGSNTPAFINNGSSGGSPSIMQQFNSASKSDSSEDPLRMMQRLSAAVKGKSFEFNNQLEAKDKLLSDDRKKAGLADLAQVGDMLSKGYVEEAKQLLNNRIDMLKQLNGNPTNTTRLLDIVNEGNIPLATTIVGQELEKAYKLDLLKRPETVDKGMTDYQAAQVRLKEQELKQKNNTPSEASIARAETQKKQASDYRSYQLVSKDLKNNYGNIAPSLTGVLQGNLPASSTESRIFETTGKQMLSLMKDVFRRAGEGTFTEGDQRVLTEMLPNRTMDAQEFDMAIRRLDAVVAMKMSNGNLTMDEILANLDTDEQDRLNKNNPDYVAPPVRDKDTQEAIRNAVYGSSKIDRLVAKHSSSGAQ